MAPNVAHPATSSEGEQGAVVFRHDDSRKYTDPQRQPQPRSTAGITRAVVSALQDLPHEDRPALLRWIAERGLLGFARQRGPRAVAREAYRMADELAGMVR
jgi:hypothetical protein